jgi:putative redox protein
MASARAEFGPAPYAQIITMRQHQLSADEGADLGGSDAGPSPSELLLGALASCVAITLQMYAGRKGWPLQNVEVDVDGHDDQGVYVIERRLTFHGDLTAEQRTRLTDIASRCPVSKRLVGPVEIRAVD